MSYPIKCYWCGKLFYAGDMSDYVYKRQLHYFCSWSCMRKYDHEQERLKKERQIKNALKRTVHKRRLD